MFEIAFDWRELYNERQFVISKLQDEEKSEIHEIHCDKNILAKAEEI